jgi:hypothetical protein
MHFINVTIYSIFSYQNNEKYLIQKADLVMKNAWLLLSAEERIQRQLEFGFLLFIIQEPVAVGSIRYTSGNLLASVHIWVTVSKIRKKTFKTLKSLSHTFCCQYPGKFFCLTITTIFYFFNSCLLLLFPFAPQWSDLHPDCP